MSQILLLNSFAGSRRLQLRGKREREIGREREGKRQRRDDAYSPPTCLIMPAHRLLKPPLKSPYTTAKPSKPGLVLLASPQRRKTLRPEPKVERKMRGTVKRGLASTRIPKPTREMAAVTAEGGGRGGGWREG